MESETSFAYPPPPPQPPSKLKKTAMKRDIAIGLSIAVVLSIVIIAIAASGAFSQNSNNGNNPNGDAPSQKTPTSVSLLAGSIAVDAGQYYYMSFTVPSTAQNPVLSGNFTASGGTGNDIKAYLMDQKNYVNWQNNHQASTNYNSSQTTAGNIHVSLSAGVTYYIVFDNTFSLSSPKTVDGQIALTYLT